MRKRSNLTIMTELLGLVKPLGGRMALAVALGVIAFVAAQLIPVLGGYAILRVAGLEGMPALPVVFTWVVILAVIRAASRCGEQMANHYIAFRLLALIRDRVFKALRRLAPAKLEGRDKGDLISVITSDIELLEVFYAHTISPICIAAVMSVIMILFIGSFHPLLGFAALLGYLAVGVAVPMIVSHKAGSLGDQLRTQSGELSAFVLDSLRGLDETMQYGADEVRIGALGHRTDLLSSRQQEMSRNTGYNAALTNTLILLFDLLMLVLSVVLFLGGAVGYDGVMIPTIAMMASFGPVSALAGLGSTLQNTLAAGDRVLDLLEEKPAVDEIRDGQDLEEFTGAKADGVVFAYGEDKVLRGFTAEFEKGKITGISGKSGSGKSTLLRMLMRFWKADEGTVSLSGVNVNEINTASLREHEGYVTQETVLFHDTIENNIRLAMTAATREEVEAACKKASVHDFIMSLPEGYDTQVGELGETLSAGERQRIGLARAFLHDAPLLLLDEPTSSLDSLNEAVILRSLADEAGKRTVVLVSHRESTMRICDKVYTVEAGKAVG